MIMSILKIYLLFWTFAIIGWVLEVIVCSISDKKMVNRGFLIGPYCPIYGFGAVLMLTLSSYQDHPLIIFVLSFFMCSVLEYFTSFLMEKMFQIRWWDYSHDSFNINGRVCLRNALAFGALGVLFVKYLNPFFLSLTGKISLNLLSLIGIIILIITTIDIIFSLSAVNSVKKVINKNVDKFKNKDATNDIKKLINVNYLERRLIKTYHLLEKEKDELISKLESSGYEFIVLFVIIGLIIGLSLHFISDLSYMKSISISISVSLLISIMVLVWRKK